MVSCPGPEGMVSCPGSVSAWFRVQIPSRHRVVSSPFGSIALSRAPALTLPVNYNSLTLARGTPQVTRGLEPCTDYTFSVCAFNADRGGVSPTMTSPFRTLTLTLLTLTILQCVLQS